MSAPMLEGKVDAPPAPLMTETRTAVVGALIVALGSVSMSLYTPAMPALVEAFQTTPATVKLTLTVYFGGFAFAQLVCGPLSDAYGRRPVALGFFSVYLLGSVIAAVSPAIAWLVVGRMLQGIGVAAGIAISRAIVRDQFTGQQSARIMNLIGLMLAIGPAVSPALGGVILSTVGWHAIFLVMVAYGLVVVLVLGFGVRETNRTPDPTRAHPGQIARNYILGSSGRRNTLREEVAMAIRKQRSDRSGRGALPSPGRPSVARREDRQLFWAAIAAGCSTEDAAGGARGSPARGGRRVPGGGGVPPAQLSPSSETPSPRFLT